MAHAVLKDGDVVLRPTGEQDFGILRRFFDHPGVYEMWGGTRLSDEEIREKYLGLRAPAVECFIVESRGRPVGFVQYQDADNGGEGGGMDMALLPAHRGRGIGSAVVRLIAPFVRKQRGWTRFTVDPDVSNARGVRFWTKVGFVPVRLVESDDRPPYWLMEWPNA